MDGFWPQKSDSTHHDEDAKWNTVGCNHQNSKTVPYGFKLTGECLKMEEPPESL